MTITKADIATKLAKENKILKRTAEKFVDLFFEEMAQSLENGQDLKLSGFGNFTLRNKAARPGRNPKTGEVVQVSARRVVTFHPGPKLRARMKNVKKDNKLFL